MPVSDVSHITQRMIFLRIFEVLFEAQQSIIDRRDLAALPFIHDAVCAGDEYDAGYPFCYFTGTVLDDLLCQPIVWQGQHLTLETALHQLQPDLEQWLSTSVRQIDINELFAWQPHTLQTQELVDDVKQRVLDVVDAIHSVEKIQHLNQTRLLRIDLGPGQVRRIKTGPVTHCLTYHMKSNRLEPLMYDAAHTINAKWQMHALIHGMWLCGQRNGHIRLDSHQSDGDEQILQAPLYLV